MPCQCGHVQDCPICLLNHTLGCTVSILRLWAQREVQLKCYFPKGMLKWKQIELSEVALLAITKYTGAHLRISQSIAQSLFICRKSHFRGPCEIYGKTAFNLFPSTHLLLHSHEQGKMRRGRWFGCQYTTPPAVPMQWEDRG